MQEAISALSIGMTFDESTGTIENIQLQLQKVAAGEQTLPEMTKLALLISAYINKATTDEELKKVLTQQITEALSESASYNPSGFAKMQIIFQAQIQDPKQIISTLLNQLKKAAAVKDSFAQNRSSVQSIQQHQQQQHQSKILSISTKKEAASALTTSSRGLLQQLNNSKKPFTAQRQLTRKNYKIPKSQTRSWTSRKPQMQIFLK